MTAKQIEKFIHQQVQFHLDELDIQGMIDEHTSKKFVEREVKQMVKEKVAQAVGDAFVKAFIKQNRIIDAWANEKLRNLLIELGLTV